MMDEQVILRRLSKLPKAAPVNIEFENLCYSVKGLKETKEILHSLSGKFRSGELTGILGPSGSGKTTLIKVLVGYILKQTSGTIRINDKLRDIREFHKLSVFIMQDDLLQPFLTVHESIMVSASLKLGDHTSFRDKQIIVEEILETLGLENCLDVRVECLSGGQRKRLAIALELVNNPPVIFLDEPTSGLDSVSAQQCTHVLRTLADQGKTIICTIHQPSVSIFEKFDQSYFVAEGNCVYNGSPRNMIPFLVDAGLPCPLDYSPAEHVLEIVQTNREWIPTLIKAIQNGKLNRRDSISSIDIQKKPQIEENSLDGIYPDLSQLSKKYNLYNNFPTPFWMQFYILTRRMWLQQRRNKTSLWIQLLQHTLTGLIIGGLFYGLGNDASFIFSNFMYHVCMVCFFVYTYVMRGVLLMPAELQTTKREYFNRWYSLKAYFFALTFRNLPSMMILGLEIVGVSYILSSQPLEVNRFLWFYIVNIQIAFISEGLGLAIGSIFNVKNGSTLGPVVFSVFVSLSMYGLGYGSNILLVWKVIMHASYARYALVALTLTIFQDRPLFDCHKIFCPVRDSKLLLRDFGMNQSFEVQIIGLIFFVIFYRVIVFLALKFKLNREFSNKITNYVFTMFKIQ